MSITLGRRIPPDWNHVEKYPLKNLRKADRPKGEPVVLGTNWYEAMFYPFEKPNGEFWLKEDPMSSVVGGHAYCLRPDRVTDLGTWHELYDQGSRGACVGFSCARSRSLVERRKYDGNWIYDEALKIDEWPGEADEGTSVRAGFNVMKNQGVMRLDGDLEPDEGISAYRWMTTVDEVRYVLDSPSNDKREAVRIVNSWGLSWPHYVWMPYKLLERLLVIEQGEAAVGTSR